MSAGFTPAEQRELAALEAWPTDLAKARGETL